MGTVDTYARAAIRENTRRSYRSALQHFETEWGGLLPASPDTVARYLAEHAETLSVSTLQQRLSALADWHHAHGFSDPTKAQIVRKVLKGIRALHPAQQKQARPIQLEQIAQIAHWLDEAIAAAALVGRKPERLRYTRDRALLLLGFWRGFRGDELARLRVEHVNAVSGQGMTCFLSQSKSDRESRGKTFKAPALRTLCPVEAYLAWIALAGITDGPVFRAVDRWGNVSEAGLHINSLVPVLRTLFHSAGIAFAHQYSGHSLRRGFANWATSSGWDLKTLMEYVGWQDAHSAMRYLDVADPFAQMRAAQTPAIATGV
ncbi:site-specific integrase [Massilia sp. 9096]|uniref:site-specific integrase n=1 Tax=Massilia sp. 9096 TaxID=1500894 RepID=UPI0009E00B0B|nr:site-specific integrase [Massilia sp. 9096]